MCVNPNKLKFHLDFIGFLTIMIPIVPSHAQEAVSLLLEVAPKLSEEALSPLATGSKVKMFDLDEDNKAKANVVAHGVIVSLAGGRLHGQLIEEGNVFVSVPSIEPRVESVLLYEGNNDDGAFGRCVEVHHQVAYGTTQGYLGVMKLGFHN